MRRTLILGGTAWLGYELARQLVAKGQEVTCLARGESGNVPAGARLVVADRAVPGAYDAVLQMQWDEVIELGYEHRFVDEALAALAANARHWTLVSSISVYSNQGQPGAAEDAEVHEPTDLGDYAHAKVAAERISHRVLGDRLLIVRPGLIAGPKDPSDRFSYWVSRMALANNGQVMVPKPEGRYVQAIDVRDLAAWIIKAGSRGLNGACNAVGTEHRLDDFLHLAAQVAGFTGELVVAEDDWLLEHNVNYWAGERSLPLWIPRQDSGFLRRSNERYLLAHGPERDIQSLLTDILADEQVRGLGRDRRSGLTRAEELELLTELSAPKEN